MKNRPVICNLNFFTSFGGTQCTLAIVLPMLAAKYALRIVDPYGNAEFQRTMAESNLPVETVIDLSEKPRLSLHRGIQRIVDYGIAALSQYWRVCLTFRRYLRQIAADLIYVNQTKSALIAILAFSGVPIIFHCHDANATGITLIAWLEHWLVNVIANSPHTAERLLALGFSQRKLCILENTVDIEYVRIKAQEPVAEPLPPFDHPPILLLAHAGITPNKGTLVAIEAFSNLVAKGLPGRLWIAGDVDPAHIEYTEQVRHKAQANGLSKRTSFLGPRADIYSVMAHADIVLMPTLFQESFGRVAVEAMILGKAVIVSNRGALPNLVNDKITGRIFDPDKQGDLEQAVEELICDSTKRLQYAQAGKRWAENHFRLETYQAQLLALFERTLKNGH